MYNHFSVFNEATLNLTFIARIFYELQEKLFSSNIMRCVILKPSVWYVWSFSDNQAFSDVQLVQTSCSIWTVSFPHHTRLAAVVPSASGRRNDCAARVRRTICLRWRWQGWVYTRTLFCLHSSRCPGAPVPCGICMSVFALYVQCVTRCSRPYLAAWVNTFVSKGRPRAVVTLLILAECSIRVQDQHKSCTRHCADSSFTSLGPKTAVLKLWHLRLQQWVKLSNSAAEINTFTAWDTRPLLFFFF